MGSWFGNQIVIGMADDLHTREIARPQPGAQVNAAIDVRRVGFTAGNEKVASCQLRISSGGVTEEAVLP